MLSCCPPITTLRTPPASGLATQTFYHRSDPREVSAASVDCDMDIAYRKFVDPYVRSLLAKLNDSKEARKCNEEQAINYLHRLAAKLCAISDCNCNDYNWLGECCASDCPNNIRTQLEYEIQKVIGYIYGQKELVNSTEELKRGYFTGPCLKLLPPHATQWVSHWNVRFSEPFIAHYGLQGVLLPGRSIIRFVNNRLYFIIIGEDESRITTFHELAFYQPEFREKFVDEYNFVALVKLFNERLNGH